jgi:primosomal replication protein N''
VRRAKPIEVINVNGVYEKQTNEEEAEQVVEVLAKIWSSPPDQRPTIGVATFNRKQADLVEDAIEQRAIGDSQFLSAYQRERERTSEGEDVGFFVKNVENVQGDERDIIIFSTTFGRDRHGSFRKNFGVLGQSGGERRLNVAVTRAKEKVILLTSMPVREISDLFTSTRLPSKPRDYLQAYLDYATKISAGDLEAAREVTQRMNGHHQRQQRQFEHDGFASSVGSFLRDIGYEPVPADDGDAFGLDFAIRNGRTGLFGIGIECDAPRHELLRRARAREIWRPRVLSRAIPVIHRVASHAWYHRPGEEKTRLHTAIREALSEDAR